MSSLTTKTSQKITATLINVMVLSGLMPYGVKSVSAQTILACEDVKLDLLQLSNNAFLRYGQNTFSSLQGNNTAGATTEQYGVVTNTASTTANPTKEANLPLRLVALGIEDQAGNTFSSLGAIALDLNQLYQAQGLNSELAQVVSLSTIEQWATLSPTTASEDLAGAIKAEVAPQISDLDSRNAILELDATDLLTILGGFGNQSLKSLGLPNNQIELLSQTQVVPESAGEFNSQIARLTQTATEQVDSLATEELLTEAQGRTQQELSNLSQGKQTEIPSGSEVRFRFRLDNQRNNVATIELPDAAAITKSGLIGTGEVTGVTYRLIDDVEPNEAQEITEAQQVSIPAQSSLELNVAVATQGAATNQVESIEIALQPGCGEPIAQSFNLLPPLAGDNDGGLIDPLGQITGCGGEVLDNYQGFSIALYDPDPNDPTGSSLQNLTPLTETELPDQANNDIPKGVEPNTQNSNPFFMTNALDISIDA